MNGRLGETELERMRRLGISYSARWYWDLEGRRGLHPRDWFSIICLFISLWLLVDLMLTVYQ